MKNIRLSNFGDYFTIIFNDLNNFNITLFKLHNFQNNSFKTFSQKGNN